MELKAYLVAYVADGRSTSSVFCITEKDLCTMENLSHLAVRLGNEQRWVHITSCQLLKDSEESCKKILEEVELNAKGRKPFKFFPISPMFF